MTYIAEHPEVVAAFLSALAAIAAAVATWRAPISAARYAETLRSESQVREDARRFRYNIFAILMQERAQIYSAEAVRALNSIDVAFNEAVAVREAWAELLLALNTNPMPTHVIEERIRKLLREMAVNLGVSEGLRLDDLGRVYYPTALAQEQRVRQLEQSAALRRLEGDTSPLANTSPASVESLWPPKPKSND